LEYTVCCICHNNKYETIYEDLPDLLLNQQNVRATLVKCTNCGLIYQNPRPDIYEIEDFYPDSYESFEPSNYEIRESSLLQRAYDYGIYKRSKFINRYKKDGRLLDVGCAVGTFLNGMRKYGQWVLQGVEINAHAAEVARNKYGLDVFTGTLEQAPFPDQSFDVITLWDVLEHLHDPMASLNKIQSLLKGDGILVMRVPNGNSLDAKIFKRHWAGLDIPRHLTVFTPGTLELALKGAGFQSIERSYSSGSYTTFLLSLRFWLTDHPFQNNMKNSLLKILYHPILRVISAPIFFPAGIFHYGPNLVVTAFKT